MKRSHAFLLILIATLTTQPLSLNSITYYLKSAGSVTVLASWSTTADGLGSAPSSFSSSTAHTWNLYDQSSITLSSTWTVSSNAIVNIGDGINPVNFILSTTQAFINTTASSATQPTINFANSATLSINANVIGNYNTASNRTIFSAGSTVIYNSGSSVRNFLSNYYHLILNSAISLTGTQNVDGDFTVNSNISTSGVYLSVNGILAINNSTITMTNNSILDLYGTMSGNGYVSTNTGPNSLDFYGSGNLGTLRLVSPFYLDYFYLSPATPNTTLTLGSDMMLDYGSFSMDAGKLDLNGNTITFGVLGNVDFSGAGTIIGSSASNVSVNTSVNGALPMEPGTVLESLTFNYAGVTFSLGSPVSVVNQLTVIEGTLVTNGYLTLEADNSRTARIAPVGSTGAIVGDVTVEAFAPGGVTGWTNLGVNGVQGQNLANWQNQIPMSCEGCTNGVVSTGSYFESILGWDERDNTFDTTINITTALGPGRGFWLYLGDGFSSTGNINWSFTGPIQQGPVSVPISSTGTGSLAGYNLISNPYASPIDWEDVYSFGTNSSNINAQIHIYNPDIPGFASYVQGGASVNGGSNVIPAGQAFYILANSSSATLDFDESVKCANNTSANPLLRSPGARENSRTLNLLKLQLTGKYDKDETVLNIVPEATSTFDPKYDAFKMFSTPGYVGYPGPYTKYTSISTKDALGADYSINSVAGTFTASIPLLVKVSVTGSYTITATEFKNFQGCSILHDLLTDTYHDIKLAPYSFQVSDTISAPRFEIVCSSKAPAQNNNGNAQQILIGKDQQGVYVKTNFEENTNAVISVCNAIGQKLIRDIVFEGTQQTEYLNINATQQVVIVRVITNNQSVSKKIIVD
jgi:hypothetical protein